MVDVDLEALAQQAIMLVGSSGKINKRNGGRGFIVTDAKSVYYFMRGHDNHRAVDILTFEDSHDPNTAAFYRFSESEIVRLGGITLSSYKPHFQGQEVVTVMGVYPTLVSAGESLVVPTMKEGIV